MAPGKREMWVWGYMTLTLGLLHPQVHTPLYAVIIKVNYLQISNKLAR